MKKTSLIIFTIFVCCIAFVNTISADEVVERKDATCTEDGYIKYKKEVSPTHVEGIQFYTESIPALGHSYNEEVIQKQSCVQDGIIRHTCTRCGDSYDDVFKKLGHNYKLETIEPTCTEKGAKIYTCTRCKDSYKEEIPELGHDYEKRTIEPDCINDGKNIYTCSRCGEVKEEVLKALGHKYGEEWIVEKEPTLFETGLKYKECLVCKEKLYEEIAKVKFTESKPAMILTATVGVGAVAAGLFFGLKTKAAIKAGTKAIKVKPKLKLPKKTIFLCLKNNELNTSFVDLIKTKPIITIKQIPFNEIDSVSNQAKIVQPHLVVFDIDDDNDLQTVLKEIDEIKDSYSTNFGIIVNKEIDDALKEKLNKLKDDGVIINYTLKEDTTLLRFVKLLLPLYKFKKNKTGVANNISIIADAFGIKEIATITNMYSTYKNKRFYIEEIKKQFANKDLDSSEILAIISNIASLLGYDQARDVSTILEDIKDIADSKNSK